MRYGQAQGEVFLGRDYARHQDYSDEMASVIDDEVRKLILSAQEEANTILSTHIDALHRLAGELLEKETLGPDEIAEVLKDVPKWVGDGTGNVRVRATEAVVSDPAMMAAHVEPSKLEDR